MLLSPERYSVEQIHSPVKRDNKNPASFHLIKTPLFSAVWLNLKTLSEFLTARLCTVNEKIKRHGSSLSQFDCCSLSCEAV